MNAPSVGGGVAICVRTSKYSSREDYGVSGLFLHVDSWYWQRVKDVSHKQFAVTNTQFYSVVTSHLPGLNV